jgi:hypothetical protein
MAATHAQEALSTDPAPPAQTVIVWECGYPGTRLWGWCLVSLDGFSFEEVRYTHPGGEPYTGDADVSRLHWEKVLFQVGSDGWARV